MSIRSTLFQLIQQNKPEVGETRARLSLDGVTIAIPNWNHEFLLARSIYSAMKAAVILRNEGIHAEVIVNDDASRDGSTTLLRQFEALYNQDGFKVMMQQINGGPGVSRNAILNYATYRYILFLDADNELIPENTPIFFQAIKDTQAAVIYGNLIIKLHNQDVVLGLYNNKAFTDSILENNYIDNMALYDRNQVTELGGYDPQNQPVEDWDLINHLAANGRLVVFVPVLFGLYYVLPQSLVRAIDESQHNRLNTRMKRVYDQFGMRRQQIIKTRHVSYHPDVGYII